MKLLRSVMLRFQLARLFSRGSPWRPLQYLRFVLCGLEHGRCYRILRRLEGARPTRCAPYEDTCGSYIAPGVEVYFYGACPVQGDGEIDGRPCYYRSRGEGWSLSVAASPDADPLDDDAWVYTEQPYIWPEGGWVHRDVSRACIEKAVAAYRALSG